MILRKHIASPGNFIKRDADGNVVATKEITSKDIASYPATFERLKAAGLYSPLIYEHPSSTPDGEGTPITLDELRDKSASKVKHTAAIPQKLVVENGKLYGDFEFPDDEAAKPFQDGRIKFISPEIRPVWFDKNGNRYENVMTHFAGTHGPVDKAQEAGYHPVPAVQFSDSTNPSMSGVFQMADGEETPAEENKDLPAVDDSSKTKDAIIANLAELSIQLPAGIDLTSTEGLAALLAATKTAVDHRQQADADDEPEGEQVVAMSEAEQRLSKRLAAMQSQLAQNNRRELLGIINSSKLPKKTKEQFVGLAGTVQFSDDGGEKPALTLRQALKLVSESVPASLAFEMSDVTTAEHPMGDAFYQDNVSGNSESVIAAAKEQGAKFKAQRLEQLGKK